MYNGFSGELGRMRIEEGLRRADRYRLAQQAAQRNARAPLSRSSAVVYRRALAAVALSAVFMLLGTAAALAVPLGPGSRAGGRGAAGISSTERTLHIPAETGINEWAPVIVGLMAVAVLGATWAATRRLKTA